MSERARHDDKWGELQAEALALIDEAEGRGLTLRLVGSTAIRAHCAPAARAVDALGRPAKDIDLVCSSRDRKGTRRLLEERGYSADRNMLVAMEGARFLYRHSETGLEVDLFVDRLEFCHTIELRDRLQMSPRTIPLEDLVLQKLQIVDLKASDVLDLTALLSVHELAEGPSHETIDGEYIAGLLARDWGFHRTATENLQKLRHRLSNSVGAALGAESRHGADERIGRLEETIESAGKSRSWRMRARIGERMQWWSDVGERTDTY